MKPEPYATEFTKDIECKSAQTRDRCIEKSTQVRGMVMHTCMKSYRCTMRPRLVHLYANKEGSQPKLKLMNAMRWTKPRCNASCSQMQPNPGSDPDLHSS